MPANDLAPEDIKVLTLIDEDGVLADLTDAQRDIRDRLEEAGYIHVMGDEYDSDFYLTAEGKRVFEKADPAWWMEERANQEKRIRELRKGIEDAPSASAQTIEHIRAHADKMIVSEGERLRRYLENANKKLAELEQDYREWLEENKDRFHD